MALLLKKGELAPFDGSLERVRVGLGWSINESVGDDYDLDVSCFLLDKRRRVRSDRDLICYCQLESSCGGVRHLGDNRVGTPETLSGLDPLAEPASDDGILGPCGFDPAPITDEDAETILVDLRKIESGVEQLIFVVTIYEATSRHQNFGEVSNAYIRIVDDVLDKEIVRFDLAQEAATSKSIILGRIFRRQGDWEFQAIGQSYNLELGQIAQSFGVRIR